MIMTKHDYSNHREEYNGYCKACKDVTNYGGVEPDADSYECETCGKNSVIGVEDALICGYIKIRGT